MSPNTERITLRRQAWTVPESYPLGDAQVKPLGAGETLAWSIARD